MTMRFFTFHSFLSLVVLVQIAQGTENSEEKPVQEPEVSTEAPSSNDETQATESSLRSIKRFRLVSEQKKTVEGDQFSVLIAREMKRKPKNERGGRGRGRKECIKSCMVL